MKVRFNDTPEKKLFRENLPKVPLTHSILLPAMNKLLIPTLIEHLKAEIEIFKTYPKDKERYNIENFNPTNHKTCFLGFIQNNADWSDADLSAYRVAIGTINHKIWGDCTLLEIWGADHFDTHPEMVKGVFSYCNGTRKTLPELKFVSIPFLITELTGKKTLDEDDKLRYMYEYLTNLNGIRATNFNLPPITKLEGKYLEDFEAQWEANKQEKL